MELILQRDLTHQQEAVDKVNQVFDGVQINENRLFYENPLINLTDEQLRKNIDEIQKKLPSEYRSNSPIGDVLNLDIKMETGERVIIVTGCINALVSRVSGTFIKNKSCIA